MNTCIGSCHCGNVSFSVESELDEFTTCDCSLCVKKNAVMLTSNCQQRENRPKYSSTMYCYALKTGQREKTVPSDAETTTITTLPEIVPLLQQVEIHRLAEKQSLWLGTDCSLCGWALTSDGNLFMRAKLFDG